MNIHEFSELVDEVKIKRPNWFVLENDLVSSDSGIIEIESLLSTKLPSEYKEFIKKFGGGDFAFVSVYSGSKSSYWNIVTRNKKIGLIESKSFLAISENGCGDYYGFRIKDGRCESKIAFYDHEEDEVKSTEYNNTFEYIMEVGLVPR